MLELAKWMTVHSRLLFHHDSGDVIGVRLKRAELASGAPAVSLARGADVHDRTADRIVRTLTEIGFLSSWRRFDQDEAGNKVGRLSIRQVEVGLIHALGLTRLWEREAKRSYERAKRWRTLHLQRPELKRAEQRQDERAQRARLEDAPTPAPRPASEPRAIGELLEQYHPPPR